MTSAWAVRKARRVSALRIFFAGVQISRHSSYPRAVHRPPCPVFCLIGLLNFLWCRELFCARGYFGRWFSRSSASRRATAAPRRPSAVTMSRCWRKREKPREIFLPLSSSYFVFFGLFFLFCIVFSSRFAWFFFLFCLCSSWGTKYSKTRKKRIKKKY